MARLLWLLFCAAICLFQHGMIAVAFSLGAASLTGFTLLFPGKWASLAGYAFWTLLSLRFPAALCFWPMLLFERPKFAPLFLLTVLWHLREWALLFALCLGGLAALFGVLAELFAKAQWENHRMRDDMTEVNFTLRQKNAALLDAQDAEVRVATLTERGRIAREIHDNVGHMLARALMQTGALQAVNQQENLAAPLDGLLQTLTDAMNSIRASVHDLREESIDLYGLIEAAAKDFPAINFDINYDFSADAPAPVQYCFAAILREAFANIKRHSTADQIRVELQEHPAFYALHFRDNGKIAAGDVNKAPYMGPAPRMGASPGMGLDNMRERALSLGGQFHVEQADGFSLHVYIPKKEEP